MVVAASERASGISAPRDGRREGKKRVAEIGFVRLVIIVSFSLDRNPQQLMDKKGRLSYVVVGGWERFCTARGQRIVPPRVGTKKLGSD